MSKVIECTEKKTVTGKNGPLVIFSVKMDDGTEGESVGKAIPPGTTSDMLVIEENGNYPKRIKLKASGTGQRMAGGARGGNASFALAYAKDVAVAHIRQGKDFKASEITTVAEVFYKWLEERK